MPNWRTRKHNKKQHPYSNRGMKSRGYQKDKRFSKTEKIIAWYSHESLKRPKKI